MNQSKMFMILAQISGLVGLGMLAGASLANGSSSTPQWIGGILILGAAVLLGMAISSRSSSKKATDDEQ